MKPLNAFCSEENDSMSNESTSSLEAVSASITSLTRSLMEITSLFAFVIALRGNVGDYLYYVN
ncbi:hypothetical protein J6590_055464 [Homalodisca vitripennis]|nr:hypothetical protein J6590_055464 [Homalodisca vitripennis]